MFDPAAATSTRFGVELVASLDAVKKAARLCEAVQQRLVAGTTLEKGDKSPVTVADFGAQAIVSHLLSREFPHIPLIGEEDASALREPSGEILRQKVFAAVHGVLPDLTEDEILDAIDRGTHPGGPTGAHFTLDPIDGTKGFLRQQQYAVALALVVDGDVEIGVLGCPNLPVADADPDRGRGVLAWGIRGEGARISPLASTDVHPLFVDDVSDPSAARFCESVESGHSDQSTSAAIARRLGITAEPYRIDSQCKYVAVARGDASIYLRLPVRADYVEKVWDHAAGMRVITEAGGRVTDVDGKPLDFSRGRRLEDNRGVIVTNGTLHEPVLAAVARELPSA
ncbi:MAG: 3'(2'),5'-bisphosphate nucleotidase [Myxococcota bacterium]